MTDYTCTLNHDIEMYSTTWTSVTSSLTTNISVIKTKQNSSHFYISINKQRQQNIYVMV